MSELINTQDIGNRKALIILKDHHYLEEIAENKYRMRVPLFEKWLKYRGHA